MVKVVVADPESGKAYQVEADEARSRRLVGLRIGDKFDGEAVGLSGYGLQITGGTDKDGFPMRFDVTGPRRARVLMAGGPGFNPKSRGERRRRLVRGGSVSLDIAQLNVRVVKKGAKPIGEILKPEAAEGKAEEGPSEKPPEEKEEPKEETKEETKPEDKSEEKPEKKEAAPEGTGEKPETPEKREQSG